jgi:hypothetical protein
VSIDRTLAICSFFPGASRIDETVRVLGATSDLLLVPIDDAPVPPEAVPHLAAQRLGAAGEVARPIKKWRTITALLGQVEIDDYDWFFFPDDDLEYGDEFLAPFLRLLRRHDIALAQPALTADSFMTWEICRQVEGSALRRTNFVEIMAPCFRRDALELLLPTIDAATSPMGYGFDLHWGFACEAAGLRAGIVDATPVAHRYRPVGKHYAGDDLHGQGYAYGARYPRLLPHEICVRETFTAGE